MGLEHQVIKITHPQLDQPIWDGTYGWIPEADHDGEVISDLEFEKDLDRAGFEVEFYKVSEEEMMQILSGKQPTSSHDEYS